MATKDHDIIQRVSDTSEAAIVHAKQDLDRAVEAYSGVRHAGSPGDVETMRVQLHSAVIGLWWRMRATLIEEDAGCWEDVSGCDAWDGDVIWRGQHPKTGETVELGGLADIGKWVDRETHVARKRTGPKWSGATDTQSVPVRLPGEAALRCAGLLALQFNRFGWDAAVQARERDDTANPY